jgi:hypothetical protein
MSKIRDEVATELLRDLTPEQASHALMAVARGINEKIGEYYREFGEDVDPAFVKGLNEGYAFVRNIERDLALDWDIPNEEN